MVVVIHGLSGRYVMRPGNLVVMLFGTSLLAGCSVGPDYVRPDASLPQHYLVNHDQMTLVRQPDLDRWWQEFNDQQLTRLVTLALSQNMDIGQAHARVMQARAGLQSANAELLPSGNINGSAARAYQSLETPMGQVASVSPEFDRYNSAYELDLQASWELDLFGRLRRQREAALAGYQAAEAAAIATRLSVAAQTADIYLGIRGLQARQNIAVEQVATLAKRLSLTKMLYDNELAAELDVRQAEGALAETRAAVTNLEESLEIAMNAMDIMLGSAPGTHRDLLSMPMTIPAVPAMAHMGTPGDLLRRRPDIIVAERRLVAANARIGAAMAEYYPGFSLSGLIGSATAVSSANLFSNNASQSAGIVGLRWRLFDFSRIDAQIDLARGEEAEMLIAYRQAALKATEDVESSLSALSQREKRVAELNRGEDAMKRARFLTVQSYEKGVLSLLEVLRADEDLLRISDARVVAHTEAARAAVSSFKALGGGWSPGEPDGQPG